MALPTLDRFLMAAANTHLRSSYVRFPGFKFLYVRCNRRYIEDEARPCIDLANITASRPGNGAFTRLFKHLREVHPTYWLYVECVLNERFEKKLLAMGFTLANKEISPSFYMPPAKRLPNARTRISNASQPAQSK